MKGHLSRLCLGVICFATMSFTPSKERDVPGISEKARYASQKLFALMPKAGLSEDQYYKLAHFIESELPYWVAKHGNYLARKTTHLPRSLACDPETGDIYIHLRSHGGIERLGKGSKKNVTHSILYHPEAPQKIAHCETDVRLPEELRAVQALTGMPGLAETRSILKRKSSKGKKIYSFMCKLYGAGSLNHVMKYDKLTKMQKFEIASDLLFALANLHAQGFVHRDICPQNFLVEKKGQHYHAVLADLGRAMPAKKAVGDSSQGHRFFNPPEALRKKKLKKNDYFGADVYATGCVLYKLFYDKEMPWAKHAFIKEKSLSTKVRMNLLKASLTRFCNKKLADIKRYRKELASHSAEIQVKALILKMIDPNPKKRGTASQLNVMMQAILQHAQSGH